MTTFKHRSILQYYSLTHLLKYFSREHLIINVQWSSSACILYRNQIFTLFELEKLVSAVTKLMSIISINSDYYAEIS